MMRTRPFGVPGVDVSVFGFGGAAVSGEGGGYGFGEISEADAINLLHRAFDLGINLFDTAPIYGFGLSELRIGRAFKDRRDQVVLVSKSGITWDHNKQVRLDNSPETTEAMLNQSLKDLGTDYIDLYLIHWPDSAVDIRKPIEVLAKAKAAGKIRAIGLSNTNPQDLAKANEITRVDVLQSEFNLFSTYPREALFEEVRRQNMGFMSWGTLDKGILTGRVTRERDKRASFDDVDVRSRATWWTQTDREPRYLAMDAITPMLAEAGYSGLQLAVGFVLAHNEVSTALCGSRTIEQLTSTLDALKHLPDPDFIAEVEAVVAKVIANASS